MARLKKRQIDVALASADKEMRLWDDDPRGLGLRIKPNGTATFFIQYSSPATFKKVRYSIDQYGRLTLDQARIEAKRLFQVVANGKDPAIEKRRAMMDAKGAITVSAFCDNYIADAEAGIVTYRGQSKKTSTLAIDRGRIKRHIKPTLGKMLVRDVDKKDIERAMHDIRQGKTAADVKTGFRGRAIVTGGAGTAARTVGLMGSIFSHAVKQGIRSDNPTRGIDLPPDGKRNRILSPDEYRVLGQTLSKFENRGINSVALSAYKLLALTGCRKSEIFGLKKSDIDFHGCCLRLDDTKTGKQIRPLGNIVLDALRSTSWDTTSEFVHPAAHGNGHLTDAKIFRRVCEAAGLKSVTLHTLRHSFASVALELEYSELTIAGLLGHHVHSITSRYTHHVDRALVGAADRVSAVIAGRLAGTNNAIGQVISLSNRAR